MALKDILVLLDGGDVAVRYSASLAGLCGAHLTGADVVPAVVIGYRMPGLPASAIDIMRAEAEKEQAQRKEKFLGAAQTAGLRAETVPVSGSIDGSAKQFALLARHFDLTVIGQVEDASSADEALLEAALFESGRPVLMVPYVHRAPTRLERAMVAWDGSEVAARAIAGAMPLLAHARHVQVVTVPNDRTGVDHPGFNIARHLARHGLPVELKVTPSTMDVGNTLLSLAADEGADFLVMGAYGHSRMRELILGGATRQILQSMTLPVLMAH